VYLVFHILNTFPVCILLGVFKILFMYLLYPPSKRSEIGGDHVLLAFPSVLPSVYEQSINRLWRHRCTASVNLCAWYNCFNRNVGPIRLVREKLRIFPFRQYIVGNDAFLAFWRHSQVQYRNGGWGEMYKNVNTVSDGFSAHATARRHYRWRHYRWHASTAHVAYITREARI